MGLLPLILLVAMPCRAATYSFKKQVDAGALEAELKAANFSVQSINCVNTDCKIVFPSTEHKDPRSVIDAHVYRDSKAERAALRLELAALEPKLDDGTATLPEMRRIQKIMLKLSGWSK